MNNCSSASLLAHRGAVTSSFLLHRCVRWPWPRNSRQWKRPAGKKARQAISQAVRCLHPGRGQLGFCHLRVATCPKTFPFPLCPQNQSPNRVPLEAPHALIWWSFHSLQSGNHWKCSLKIHSRLRTEVLPSPESELFRLTEFNLKYFPVQRYQKEGKQTLSGLFGCGVCFFFLYLKLGKLVLFVTDVFWFRNAELEAVVPVHEQS